MGAVHHDSGGDEGLVVAGTALIYVPAANGIKLFASTFRTQEALWKTLAKQFHPAGLFCVYRARNSLKMIAAAFAMMISSAPFPEDIIAYFFA